MHNRRLSGGYALIHQPGLAHGLPILVVPAGTLCATRLRSVAGTGDHQHLSFVTETVESG